MKLFESIKKIPHVINFQCRKVELKFAKKYNGDWYDAVRYRQMFGKKVNWNHPQTMHEKLLWLNRYWQPQLKADCADKYRVHEYVKSCGLEEYLVPLLGMWLTPNEIDFNKLPDQFVLKTNHGCGTNIICRDKTKLNQNDVKQKLADWLTIDFGKLYNEKHYSYIKPCIIAELYLPSLSRYQTDYKFQCINGEIYCILICADRDEKGHAQLFSYDIMWNRVPLLKDEEQTMECQFAKPKTLAQMIKAAQILSKPFPYVRVDFYEVEGQLYIGELTFTPYGNIMTYYKDTVIEDMGKRLQLPTKIKHGN